MNRRFSEMDATRVGFVALISIAVLLTGALNIGALTRVLSGGTYSGLFVDASGLKAGDQVRMSGVPVGVVRSVEFDRDRVRVTFTSSRALSDGVRLGIKSATLLGSRFLDVQQSGLGRLPSERTIPLSRTSVPYDVTDALSALTRTSGEIDTQQLARSLDTLSEVFAKTPASVRKVLGSTLVLARSVAARDTELGQLLQRAAGVSGVLAERNADIIAIIGQGNLLLGALEQRRDKLQRLFSGLNELSLQVSGLIRDNRHQLAPALRALHRSTQVINANLDAIGRTIDGFGGFSRSLMEAIGGGAFFYGYVAGLAPANMTPALSGLLRGLDTARGEGR